MNLNSVRRTIQRLESYLSRLDGKIDRINRKADDIERDATSAREQLKQNATQYARAASEDMANRMQLKQVEERLQRNQQEKLNHAQEKRNEANQLLQKKSNVENALSELRKVEGYMADYQNTAQTWVDQARQLMS